MPSAEIITIGTEILLGEIVDTNTRYIARTLRGMGVDLYRTITIGDNVERIAEAIHNSMSRAEIVITTGGLGPTVDDPTREAVAKAVDVDLEFREDLWEQVVGIICAMGVNPLRIRNARRLSLGALWQFQIPSAQPLVSLLKRNAMRSYLYRVFPMRWNTSCMKRSSPICKNVLN